MLRMDHSDSHPLHQRRKKRKRPERGIVWLSYLPTSLTSPLSFSLPKCTQTHLNQTKVRADQRWHKTGSERNEDSLITMAAEFGSPQPLSILPFITTYKLGTSFLITICLTASAVFNRHSLTGIQISVILQNESSAVFFFSSICARSAVIVKHAHNHNCPPAKNISIHYLMWMQSKVSTQSIDVSSLLEQTWR